MPLGDAVHEALRRVGVTDDRVERWLGVPCGGCRERRDRLNQIDFWTRRVLRGGWDRAEKYLEEMLG